MPFTDVAILIPALNEAASIAGVLRDLPKGVRTFVIDNGSTDETSRISLDHGATVVHEPRRGYGSAIQAGLAALQRDPPRFVAILDADHADRPQLLPLLIAPLEEGRADIVLSDRSKTAGPVALTRTQRLGNALATKLIWASTGVRYADLGPFRALRWDAMQRLHMSDPTFGWNVEMQIKAARLGLRVVEIPLPYGTRSGGESKISGSWSGAARAGVRILWAVGHYRLVRLQDS